MLSTFNAPCGCRSRNRVVESPSLQFAPLHRGPRSLVLDLEVQSSSSLSRCYQRPFLHGELGGFVGCWCFCSHDFLGSSEHIHKRRRVLHQGVAAARFTKGRCCSTVKGTSLSAWGGGFL